MVRRKPTAARHTKTDRTRASVRLSSPDAHQAAKPDLLERAGLLTSKWKLAGDFVGQATRSDQFASFQTDAPACDNCGAITVRNGNCYLCHNCGNSMGCS